MSGGGVSACFGGAEGIAGRTGISQLGFLSCSGPDDSDAGLVAVPGIAGVDDPPDTAEDEEADVDEDADDVALSCAMNSMSNFAISDEGTWCRRALWMNESGDSSGRSVELNNCITDGKSLARSCLESKSKMRRANVKM